MMTVSSPEPASAELRPLPSNRRLLNATQLCEYLSIGRTAAYMLLSGPLAGDVIRIGRSVRVPIEAVEAWIAEQRAANRAG